MKFASKLNYIYLSIKFEFHFSTHNFFQIVTIFQPSQQLICCKKNSGLSKEIVIAAYELM